MSTRNQEKATHVKVATVAFMLVISSQQAASQTTSATLTVTASSAKECVLGASTMSMNFGVLSPSNPTNVDAQADLSIRCSSGVPYVITAGLGGQFGNFTGIASTRNMVNATSQPLPYYLYLNPARTVEWTSGPGFQATGSGSGFSGAATTFTIYGRIPASAVAAVAPGSYSDSVAIVVTF